MRIILLGAPGSGKGTQVVSDDIVLGMINERLQQSDTEKGFILDGFPRNQAQGVALDGLLEKLGNKIDAVVFIDINPEKLVARLTQRVTCEDCGQMYNLASMPPKTESICDKCSGALVHRKDDNEDTILKRVDVFMEQTSPLVNYYKAQNRLHTFEGTHSIDDVQTTIIRELDKLLESA